jgi:hypothetical protein
MIQGVFVSGNHPLFVCVHTIFGMYLLPAVSGFVFVSGVYVFVSASLKKQKQMWHQ